MSAIAASDRKSSAFLCTDWCCPPRYCMYNRACLAAAKAARAAAAPRSITVQLLTGDRIEVEVDPEDRYMGLHLSVWKELPEEYHVSGGIDAMMLLLDGEVIPMDHTHATFSREVYHLLMDPVHYKLQPIDNAGWARDLNHPQRKTYHVLDVVVHSRESKTDSFVDYPIQTILYDEAAGRYYALNDIAHERYTTHNGDDGIVVWIEPDNEAVSAETIVGQIMDLVEGLLQPSVAGKRYIQAELEAELTGFENMLDS
jgi:hypothetical protein